MLPDTTIYVYEAMQGLVEERITRAKHRAKIHRLMQATRARKQFRRSVAQSLRQGLRGGDLASELRSVLRAESAN
jgi:hypothetical protein